MYINKEKISSEERAFKSDFHSTFFAHGKRWKLEEKAVCPLAVALGRGRVGLGSSFDHSEQHAHKPAWTWCCHGQLVHMQPSASDLHLESRRPELRYS